MNNTDDLLRYPVGKFTWNDTYTKEEIRNNISRIESVPAKIEALIRNFSAAQYETVYREGGWNAREVLHHIADSHMNAYIRFKWTLTEETPTIKAYNEKLWAETPETKLDPALSVTLIKALHIKWVAMLKLLSPADLDKQFFHPDTKKHISLHQMISLYAWHGEHHLAHLEIIAKK